MADRRPGPDRPQSPDSPPQPPAGRPVASAAGAERRRRLVAATLGRRIDEAYLTHPEIRQDVEAEAASGDPDALVTPEMLGQLHALIQAEHRQLRLRPALMAAPGVAPEPGPSLGQLVHEAVRAEPAPEEEAPPNLGAAPDQGRGLEVFAPQIFFSTDQVVLVPGFLGSSLSDAAAGGLGLIWISPWVVLRDELGKLQLGPYGDVEFDLDPRVSIHAVGAIPYVYDLLRLALEVHRYTVEVFAVDWRKNLEVAAGMLAARLQALAGQSSRPIHVIAHSQGALATRRALQLLGPDEARRIVRHLVLLGPANFGSFSAAFALAGNHSLLPLLRKFVVAPPQGFQPVLASWSGGYQLLPFDPSRVPWLARHDYSQPGFWKQPVDSARLRTLLAWARAVDTSFLNDRTTTILGDNFGQPTTGGVRYDGDILVDDPEFNLAGDGTVPHSCSVLPGTQTYQASSAEHSMLATYSQVIDAVRAVLADEPVGLTSVSSDPADHLRPMHAPAQGLAAPGLRATPQ